MNGPTPRHFWTDAEIAHLRKVYADVPTAKIAARLELKIHVVYAKAYALGLKKSPAFFASAKSGRLVRGTSTGASGRFMPGQKAWNKGMKGLDIGGKATRFKPGHRLGRAAENYKPIGTERISQDGYLERRVNRRRRE